MKILRLALAVACAAASTAAAAKVVVEKQSNNPSSAVSTCYYQYSIIAEDGIYDVYTCYSNGDGSY